MTNSEIIRIMAEANRKCGYKEAADSLDQWADDKEDYCPVGMSYCVVCGWRHPRGVQVSGCPNCKTSFC